VGEGFSDSQRDGEKKGAAATSRIENAGRFPVDTGFLGHVEHAVGESWRRVVHTKRTAHRAWHKRGVSSAQLIASLLNRKLGSFLAYRAGQLDHRLVERMLEADVGRVFTVDYRRHRESVNFGENPRRSTKRTP
jgi:hypothetical protein